VRLADPQGLPLAAETLLHRARTDWFPEFLSHGRMRPHFQPIIDLANGRPLGREALMRGKLGAVELRGGELLAAAEAHDALYSFDMRARAAALETGLPLLPEGEILFVNLDPRAVIDVESSCGPRGRWSSVSQHARPDLPRARRPERCPDRDMLEDSSPPTGARRADRARRPLRRPASLAYLEALKPDFAKIDIKMTAGIQYSAGRRRLVAALVECAHEGRTRVVAEGVERIGEFEAMALGVDFGQGFYFGQPTERPMAVDPRLVRARSDLRSPSGVSAGRAVAAPGAGLFRLRPVADPSPMPWMRTRPSEWSAADAATPWWSRPRARSISPPSTRARRARRRAHGGGARRARPARGRVPRLLRTAADRRGGPRCREGGLDVRRRAATRPGATAARRRRPERAADRRRRPGRGRGCPGGPA
jgi:EAL domain-containing protein (putative c-di-GMP-specific phosphodiesterase class I)